MPTASPSLTPAVHKDLKTLALFIEIYCKNHHSNRSLSAPILHNTDFTFDQLLSLCPSCRRLLTHALVKRLHCKMSPKPACKHCPNHCYAPSYRNQIQEVMRYSGRHLLLHGRIDYLLHLLF